MDPTTIDRLAAEYPQRYMGGIIDRRRIITAVTTPEAWANAVRCLGDDNEPRAAYWAGWARAGEAT